MNLRQSGSLIVLGPPGKHHLYLTDKPLRCVLLKQYWMHYLRDKTSAFTKTISVGDRLSVSLHFIDNELHLPCRGLTSVTQRG